MIFGVAAMLYESDLPGRARACLYYPRASQSLVVGRWSLANIISKRLRQASTTNSHRERPTTND
jgi:hypothetical protein